MPKVSNTPAKLKPYVFHGVSVDYTEGSGKDDVIGLCPFCGAEKLSIKVADGRWRCFACNTGSIKDGKAIAGGNIHTFLNLLCEMGKNVTREDELRELATNRKLLDPATLTRWGVVRHPILRDDWILPGYNLDGVLKQVYRYSTYKGKKILLATPELGHCLYGVERFKKDKPLLYLCEGPWDAMALEEVLSLARDDEGTYKLTGNKDIALISSANVLAVPGCGTFLDTWLPVFSGKDVYILYDNDWPKVNPVTGQELGPVGYESVRRVASAMGRMSSPPKHIGYLVWGEEGYTRTLPSGYDVRDFFSYDDATGNPPNEFQRVGLLSDLVTLLEPVPTEWLGGSGSSGARDNKGELHSDIEPIRCESWSELIEAWSKAMHWTDGLDRALSFGLAIITSTPCVGDQLWGKLIGPPSCGKSTLCEALSVARQWIVPKSTIRGFHSGMRGPNSEGEGDMSLLSRLKNKTLVTKDGDTLLQSPNRAQILSEARDMYDRVSRSHYRNGAGGDYTGYNITWLLCGTPSLRTADLAELGERFLICDISETHDVLTSNEILWDIALRAERNMSFEANGLASSHYDPDMIRAMQLTGGYIDYLRVNSQRLLDACKMPREHMGVCIKIAQLVADLRARPSLKQSEVTFKEFSARLLSQHIRLAKCLAVVMGRDSVDALTMKRVRQVGIDTASGKTLEIAGHLYREQEDGVPVVTLAIWISYTEKDTRALLLFLRSLDVVETIQGESSRGRQGYSRWRLTQRAYNLYHEVVMEAMPE